MSRNGYQHMVVDHYVDKVRAMRAARAERLCGLRTEDDVAAYQQHALEAIREAFAPRPPKTPLNTRVTGVIERPEFRIEKLMFESRPGCYVTANLYIPANLSGPAPGVVGPCGHSGNGKACDLYSGYAQRLALNGFITLIYDPFNQGERDQYHGLEARDPVKGCCAAHNMMGKQLELLGEYFGMWRVWDGMRALDVLLERPEVDPTHLGVTGNSGGGTLTSWLWAAEERFTMAAPSCFITTFLHNLENELPADCEQYPPGVIGAGLDMADLLIARAPKPIILLGQTFDFFDRRGLKDAYSDLSHVYGQLGVPEKAALFIGPQGHGYSIHNQEAMVDFFAEQVGKPTSDVVRIEETEVFPDEELWATDSGNTIAAGATPIFTMIAAKANELAEKRKPLASCELRTRLAELLDLPARETVPQYRVPRSEGIGGDTVARYAVETEDRIRAILFKRLEDRTRCHTLDVEDEVSLWVPHTSAAGDMADDPLAHDLGRPGPMYAVDVRGVGDSMPEPHGGAGFFQPYGMDYMMHGHGILFGESYLGRRVHDLLSVIDLLVDEGAQTVKLYGRGQGALIALFAALLHDNAKLVALKNAPASFHEWTQAPLVTWPSANFLRGALTVLDIPDCIAALGYDVEIIDPWGPGMEG